jgi:predicted ribosome quality control (RQC) complex YloA/Tae2 family protein
MPFDGILTHFMAAELHGTLSGGRIGKIWQLGRDTIIMQVRAGGENYRLLASCNAASPRIHLTEKQYENPENPPVFCMLLRKHLSGAIIRGFRTNGFERVIIMEAESTDELGDRSAIRLVVEIMGRHSNIILLNRNNVIIDAIRHVDSDVNRVRELLPARPYISPPAQDKLDPSTEETLTEIRERAAGSSRKIEGLLLDTLQGFSPVLCRELCARAGIDEARSAGGLSGDEIDRLTHELGDMMSGLMKGGIRPAIVTAGQSGNYLDFHAVELIQYPASVSFETLSQAVDAFYHEHGKKEINSQRTMELVKSLGKQIEKCEKRLEAVVRSYEENKDYERFCLFGELITSNIYAISKGMDKARLLNYYSDAGEYVEIELDRDKNPQDNAQRYFKRYYKARSAFGYARDQMEALKAELAYLESVMFAVENSDDNNQLQDIRLELFEQGYLRVPPLRGKRAAEMKSSPMRLMSSDGFEILIGRNNKQNDRLTLKSSRHEDLWFHTKNFPGSHVVVRAEGRDIPESTILEAAGYAAWFSKARSAPKVEVDYTHIRNVKKPAGARPGMVIYVNYSTVMVAPKAPK